MVNHPTISAWHRDEEGSYQAEIRGYTLRVKWTGTTQGHEPQGFVWQVAGPDGLKRKSREVHEEIEVAMAEAEEQIGLEADNS